MNFRSTIIGIAASAILLAVLGMARLFTIEADVPDLTIREVDIATFQPPPPPPPIDEPPPDISPPPTPALTEVSALPDLTRVPIPQAQVPMDITAPVENFFTDLAPAPLPVEPEKVSPRTTIPARVPANLPPVEKTHYNPNELDGIPRLLRHGSTTFPANLAKQGVKSGTVTFEVELSTTGSVSVRSVISSTHKELVEPARKVAASARFTPPKRNGQAVKAIMRWPIVIEK
ncbi:MAG: TonB family protein [Akkermansiaceae bacterium]